MGISSDSVKPSRQEEARALSSSGDHSTAVSIWKSLLEQAPDSPEVWRGLGEALSSAGYEDRAVQCMKRADQIESDTNEQSEPEISTGIHDDVDELTTMNCYLSQQTRCDQHQWLRKEEA